MILFALLQRLFGLLSLALLAAGGWLIWSWWDLREALAEGGLAHPEQYDEPWRLYLGLALVAVCLFGRPLVLLLAAEPGGDERRLERRNSRKLVTTDGAELHIETDGPDAAPALVLVHGWGMDLTTWCDARRMLGRRYNVIAYDLAGLGKSTPPEVGAYTMERMAGHLREVIELAGRKQVVLVGHSIGGMIIQTFCSRYPELLSREVAGVVLANTTYVDPLKTMLGRRVFTALQKPLIEPLMRVTIWLSPLVWALNWHHYLTGANHLAMRLAGFGSRPTRAQLDQAALLPTRNSPAVQARGNLAMLRWPGAEPLSEVRVPALVFVGEKDHVTQPDAGEHIGRQLPMARVERVREAGHMGPVERAELYDTEIAAFADRVFSRGAQPADARAPKPPPRPIVERSFAPSDEPRPVRH